MESFLHCICCLSSLLTILLCMMEPKLKKVLSCCVVWRREWMPLSLYSSLFLILIGSLTDDKVAVFHFPASVFLSFFQHTLVIVTFWHCSFFLLWYDNFRLIGVPVIPLHEMKVFPHTLSCSFNSSFFLFILP